MITSSLIDELEKVLNTSPFDLDKAQDIAGKCVRKGRGTVLWPGVGLIDPSDEIIVNPDPELKKALMSLIRCHSKVDGKYYSKQLIKMARWEFKNDH